MSANLAALLYLVSGVLFILALRGLSSPETSRRGNVLGMVGMALAIATTLAVAAPKHGITWLMIIGGFAIGGGIGAYIARRIPMTAMPQLVAAFHSLVGLAAVFVAAAALYAPEAFGIGTPGNIAAATLIEMSLGVAIGAITFSGSVIAFLKLDGRMSGAPIMLTARHLINIALAAALIILIALFCGSAAKVLFWLITVLALMLGVLIIIPIGGADMPVVISMLNSYSGWAAAGIGFTLGNSALIITGALVGSSGAILSYIMCKGMNRSFISVILGGFGGETTAAAGAAERQPVKRGSADDAAFILKNSSKVIIVPGYGMAVAQAQHALRDMADKLKKEGVEISYAIHPVAGRMPGHMNVLLAEARRAVRRAGSRGKSRWSSWWCRKPRSSCGTRPDGLPVQPWCGRPGRRPGSLSVPAGIQRTSLFAISALTFLKVTAEPFPQLQPSPQQPRLDRGKRLVPAPLRSSVESPSTSRSTNTVRKLGGSPWIVLLRISLQLGLVVLLLRVRTPIRDFARNGILLGLYILVQRNHALGTTAPQLHHRRGARPRPGRPPGRPRRGLVRRR